MRKRTVSGCTSAWRSACTSRAARTRLAAQVGAALAVRAARGNPESPRGATKRASVKPRCRRPPRAGAAGRSVASRYGRPRASSATGALARTPSVAGSRPAASNARRSAATPCAITSGSVSIGSQPARARRSAPRCARWGREAEPERRTAGCSGRGWQTRSSNEHLSGRNGRTAAPQRPARAQLIVEPRPRRAKACPSASNPRAASRRRHRDRDALPTAGRASPPSSRARPPAAAARSTRPSRAGSDTSRPPSRRAA